MYKYMQVLNYKVLYFFGKLDYKKQITKYAFDDKAVGTAY